MEALDFFNWFGSRVYATAKKEPVREVWLNQKTLNLMAAGMQEQFPGLTAAQFAFDFRICDTMAYGDFLIVTVNTPNYVT